MKNKYLFNLIIAIGAIIGIGSFSATSNISLISSTNAAAHALEADKPAGTSPNFYNIATIDINEVFQKSAAGSKLTQEIKTKQEELRKTFSTKEQELQERDKVLASQRDILSEKALKEKMASLNQDVMQLQEQVKEAGSRLEKAYYNALDIVSAQVKDIVDATSKNNNIDLVLQKSQIIYKSDNINDITDSVLMQLDKQLPRVELKLIDQNENNTDNKTEKKIVDKSLGKADNKSSKAS